MAKCMQCGGSTKMKKMAKGGMPTKVLGPAKQPFAAGIPFFTGSGQTGPDYMKKGGLVKKQKGGTTDSIKKDIKFLKDQKESKVPKRISDLKMSVEEQIKQNKKSKINKYSKGGSLKPVPSDKVGLSKLPTAVRNKMGYMKKGGVNKK